MKFTLRQIEVFVEAAQDGNFRKTADRLAISQPTISRHIQLLERSAGGRLFERSRGSSARLSPLGHDLLEEARRLLATAGKVQREDTATSAGTYLLRIAVGSYLHERWLRPLVRKLYALEGIPDIRLIELEDPAQVVNQVKRGDADIGYYTGIPARETDLVSDSVSLVSVGLYGKPSLVRELGPAPEQIAAAPMILPLAGSRAALWQSSQLARLGCKPRNVVSRSQFPDVVLDLAIKGTGLGLFFDGFAAKQVRAGRLVRLPLAFEPGHRCFVSRAAVVNEGRARKVLNFLNDSLKNFQE